MSLILHDERHIWEDHHVRRFAMYLSQQKINTFISFFGNTYIEFEGDIDIDHFFI